tara:strand:- start:561 stop:767 length:207 start_codon:yes stop_codon:yes gene_type:complete
MKLTNESKVIIEYKKLINKYLNEREETRSINFYNQLIGFSEAIKLMGWTTKKDNELIDSIHESRKVTN